MVALLDVNVLIALFDPAHIHHETAHNWFGLNRRYRWATRPLTENAFVRVLSSPAYPGRGTTIDDARFTFEHLLCRKRTRVLARRRQPARWDAFPLAAYSGSPSDHRRVFAGLSRFKSASPHDLRRDDLGESRRRRNAKTLHLSQSDENKSGAIEWEWRVPLARAT